MNRLRMVEEKKKKEAEVGDLVEVEPSSCGYHQHEAELVQYEVCRLTQCAIVHSQSRYILG